jgi:ATP-dependent DNA helicase RecG
MSARAAAHSNTPAEARLVQYLPGVGPKLAEVLRDKLSILTVADLWFHLPLRYQDRTRILPLRAENAGQEGLVEGEIEHAEIAFRGKRQLFATLFNGHSRVKLRFFHFRQSQLAQLQQKPTVRVFGELRLSAAGLEMVHPELRIIDATAQPLDTRLTPIYPKTEGLSDERLRKLVHAALRELPDTAELERVPLGIRQALGWPDIARALHYVHAPPPGAQLAELEARTHPAQRRLAAEELLAHQLSMRLQRARQSAQRAPTIMAKGALRSALLAQLSFRLTDAQQRVLGEIQSDLARSKPMLRLVQGDVGSGKTVVAAIAAALCVECGLQVAMLAPTELLAEQHFRNFQRWFAPLDVRVVWFAGKVQGKARAVALAEIAAGAQIIVGTHALMSESVQFAQLGLCIVDEQHRFGVRQRLSLRDKGQREHLLPHQLVMTATPIPRTLAMVSYADLDVSVIDELPAGRSPIQTVVVSGARRDELIARIRAACAQGRQAYWVCTLIEESELLEAQAAENTWQELTAALPELAIGLVHGRLKAKEKDAVMQAFARAELQLLVATTVIEVGVDVPNASLMLIDNAERLGLSQLHQLRGRVGRGRVQSSCVLIYQPPLSENARARLNILRESTDGFVIAERDLELRGPGELLGTKQTGEARFRIADLQRDHDLLDAVRGAADQMLADKSKDSMQRCVDLIRRWIGLAERFGQA